MISVDRVYKTLLMLSNSDIRGNVKPSDLRLALYDVVNEICEDYFSEINRLVNRENRRLMSSGLTNIPDRLREKINHFLSDTTLSFSSGVFTLPANYRYIDIISYNDTEVEVCKNAKEFNLVKNNSNLALTLEYPIYLKQGDTIKIVPISIQTNVTASYLRKPLVPNWTYTVIGGAEIFNPSAPDFQDIDLHPSEENNVIVKTLKRFGINLKETDLQVSAQNTEQSEFNQDNATDKLWR